MKVISGILIAIVILGLGASMVGFAMIDFDIENLNWARNEDFEKIEHKVEGEFSKIDINLDMNPVKIVRSNNEECTIIYPFSKEHTDKLEIEINLHDGVLKVENLVKSDNIKHLKNMFKNFWLLRLDESTLRVTISIPKSYEGDLKIDSSVADIDGSNLGKLKNFTINASNSSVRLTNFESENIYIDTSNGSFNLENIICPLITLKSSNGTIEANGIEGKTLKADTSNGKIIVKNSTLETLVCDTSNGKIIVEKVVANKMDLDSSNGSIEIVLIGKLNDYKFDLDTSNGHIKVDGDKKHKDWKGGNGSKIVNADTSNGSIDVTFKSEG